MLIEILEILKTPSFPKMVSSQLQKMGADVLQLGSTGCAAGHFICPLPGALV